MNSKGVSEGGGRAGHVGLWCLKESMTGRKQELQRLVEACSVCLKNSKETNPAEDELPKEKVNRDEVRE